MALNGQLARKIVVRSSEHPAIMEYGRVLRSVRAHADDIEQKTRALRTESDKETVRLNHLAQMLDEQEEALNADEDPVAAEDAETPDVGT